MKKLKEIFNCLGMNEQNGLYITAENKWQRLFSARTKYLIEEKLLNPTAFFCIDKKPIVLFYDSPKPENREPLFKAIWNFNESPVVIINEPNTVEIFNGLSYLKEKVTLEKLGDENKLNDFSYFELVTGKTWQEYRNKLKYENRVDYKLLKNIESARDLLIKKHQIDSSLANALIGKCIFIRYLIDREVSINFEGNLHEWTNNEFCNLLQNKNQTIAFLKYLKDQFNGEAFLIDDDDLKEIPEKAYNVLSQLMRGDEIATGQMSLFDMYNFSIIPVEFISNVYEHFIGENQAGQGAYYTPLFLVDYIISETVEKYFDNNPEEYNCKILDPSCGSGVFLVEALRRMIEQYKKINDEIDSDTLKEIAENNIYGIDIDGNAINVAIFSIYLALLDYQEPKEIENFTFPKLKKNGNFFTDDFFNLKADFNNKFAGIKFDFILGNPPWKRGGNEKDLFVEYIKQRKEKELNKETKLPQITISNNEIAQAFLLRTSDFSNKQTKCALIVTSKTLYNLKAKDFRAYFLHNYFIDQVFELAPVRHEVFDKSNDPAIAPAAILFFHDAHKETTNKNVIKHIALKPNHFFSLFKIFTMQRNDYKEVVQARLKKYDWLWKVLVYGSYLDFNFIRRLREGYKTIGNIVNNNNDFLVKQGVKFKDEDKKINVEELLGWNFLATKKLESFFIPSNNYSKWEKDTVAYIYRDDDENIVEDLFKAPILLITEGINKKLETKSAISYKDCVFKSSLTGIKLKNPEKLDTLRIINGLLNSNLFSYNILQIGSSAGIEREQAHDDEKWDFPYVDNPLIAEYVGKIEAISEKRNVPDLILEDQVLKKEKDQLIEGLNAEILKSFDLNEQEKALVDYAVTITIPLIMKHKGYEKELLSALSLNDETLKEYAGVFINKFGNIFNEQDKYFQVEVWYNKYIIGIFFNVVKDKPIEIVKLIEKENDIILKKIASLGFDKISENLFIQKDIRGFEENGFYVIKPNEKKLWHKAIAYLDFYDFYDAILIAGREAKEW